METKTEYGQTSAESASTVDGLRLSGAGTRLGGLRVLLRRLRLWFYHLVHGPDFDYHGIRIVLPDNVLFSFKRLVMRGRYEEPERRLVEKYLDPSLPVVELGGSLGILSAYVGSRLLLDTKYRVVEANAAVIPVCRINANSARTSMKTEVVLAAVAYGTDEVSFSTSPNVHISRASRDGSGNVVVPATTLGDQVVAVGGEDAYTLIMDIEGMEYDVLLNEPETFRNCRLAVMEYHPAIFEESGRTVEEFLALAKNAGLEILEQIDNSVAFRSSV